MIRKVFKNRVGKEITVNVGYGTPKKVTCDSFHKKLGDKSCHYKVGHKSVSISSFDV